MDDLVLCVVLFLLLYPAWLLVSTLFLLRRALKKYLFGQPNKRAID